jgi:hypothetical protein
VDREIVTEKGLHMVTRPGLFGGYNREANGGL